LWRRVPNVPGGFEHFGKTITKNNNDINVVREARAKRA
jgi:hypothetical protein